MGNVVVAANIKRESVRIDPSGNEINPRTKQILKPVEPEFVAPVQQSTAKVAEDPALMNDWEEPKKTSKMDEMINKLVEKKIEEMVAKKVEEALNKL